MPVVTLRDESKQQGDFYVPRFEIKIAGANLPRDVLRDVVQVTYKDNVKELDSFELTVNNWDAEHPGFQICRIGNDRILKPRIRCTALQSVPSRCRCLHGLWREPGADGEGKFHDDGAELSQQRRPDA